MSVVTPVYNGEKYLPECIESVLRQTYENWEYVIVDNRSTDRSLEIAREYAASDRRIRVQVTEEFLTREANFNYSIRQLSDESKYCKIVHADDWLFPECLTSMVKLAEENPSVGIVGSYRLERTKVSLDGVPYGVSVISGRELCRSTLLGGPYPYLFGSPSSLLIRSDLIRAREPFYNEANHTQSDQEACYETLQGCDFGFVHQVLTYTRRHDESASVVYSWRIGAKYPDNLVLLTKFGPRYLSREEYERRLAVRIALYASFLLRNAGRARDPLFRQYHSDAIKTLRRELTAGEAARGIVLQLERTVGRMAARLRRDRA